MEGGALAKTLFGNESTKPDYRCSNLFHAKKNGIILGVNRIQRCSCLDTFNYTLIIYSQFDFSQRLGEHA